MERTEIKDRIKKVLVAELKHDNFTLTDELTAQDVDGWDSLSHLMIITGIESEFCVKFKLKELNKLRNMGTLVDLVQAKLG